MATQDVLSNLRHVTIRDLEIFREACTRGSLRAAGRVFRLQAPHVSKILARLEDRMGVRLLERSPKGVTPTLAGQELLEAVRRLSESLKPGAAKSPQPGDNRKVLSCAAASFLAVHVLGRLVGRLGPEFPFRLRVGEMGTGQMLERGVRAQIDVAIHAGTVSWTRSWVSRHVGEIRWGLFGRALHPLGPQATSERVAAFPFIVPVAVEESGVQFGEDRCPLSMSDRRHGTEATTAGIGLQVAAATNELIFAPQIVAQPFLDQGSLREIVVAEWKPVRERLWVSAHKDRVPQKALSRLTEVIRDQLSR